MNGFFFKKKKNSLFICVLFIYLCSSLSHWKKNRKRLYQPANRPAYRFSACATLSSVSFIARVGMKGEWIDKNSVPICFCPSLCWLCVLVPRMVLSVP